MHSDGVTLIVEREFLTLTRSGEVAREIPPEERLREREEIYVAADFGERKGLPDLILEYTLPEREVAGPDRQPISVMSTVVSKPLARMTVEEIRRSFAKLDGVLNLPLSTHYPSAAPVRERYTLVD